MPPITIERRLRWRPVPESSVCDLNAFIDVPDVRCSLVKKTVNKLEKFISIGRTKIEPAFEVIVGRKFSFRGTEITFNQQAQVMNKFKFFSRDRFRSVVWLGMTGVACFFSSAGVAQSVVPSEPIASRVAACIACHGREGATGNSAYFPRLAGKPAGYLFNQLKSFRDGRRTNADMVYLVQHMSDSYLQEIATYFAGLELPYPAISPVTDASRETLARGRKLVFEGDSTRGIPACTQCHGTALTGVQPGIPALVGLPRLYLSSQLGAWINRDRHALAPDCMADVGRRLDAGDINAAASWLATQPVPADARPSARLPAPLPMRCASMPEAAVEAATR